MFSDVLHSVEVLNILNHDWHVRSRCNYVQLVPGCLCSWWLVMMVIVLIVLNTGGQKLKNSNLSPKFISASCNRLTFWLIFHLQVCGSELETSIINSSSRLIFAYLNIWKSGRWRKGDCWPLISTAINELVPWWTDHPQKLEHFSPRLYYVSTVSSVQMSTVQMISKDRTCWK